MTPEEFEKRMEEIYQKYYIEDDDEEEAHERMDDLMCYLLDSLGYGDGVNRFINTPKWYS